MTSFYLHIANFELELLMDLTAQKMNFSVKDFFS